MIKIKITWPDGLLGYVLDPTKGTPTNVFDDMPAAEKALAWYRNGWPENKYEIENNTVAVD